MMSVWIVHTAMEEVVQYPQNAVLTNHVMDVMTASLESVKIENVVLMMSVEIAHTAMEEVVQYPQNAACQISHVMDVMIA